MDLFGVGPLELIMLFLIIFLVLGPNDLAATGKKIGRFLSTVRKSEFWHGVNEVSKEIRSLPTTLMREAELEDAKREIENDFNQIKHVPQEFKMSEFKIPQPKIKPAPTQDPESDLSPEQEASPENGSATSQPSLPDSKEDQDS